MALSSDPLLLTTNKRNQRPDKQAHLNLRKKAAEQFVKKLTHAKNALRLLTCEFDDQLLQFPGLLGALTPRLEIGWQSSNIQSGAGNVLEWEMRIASQLPALIKPMTPAQHGPTGPVPLSYSFTWTKYQPKIIDETNQELDIQLEPIAEPEVVLLLTGEQIKNLTKEFTGRKNQQIPTLSSFGACLKQLGRPVTCIFLTGAKLRTLKKNRPSSICAANRISINQLCAQLQIEWGVRATRICSDVNEVALILASYTRSIGERPFKEGRLLRDEGLTFLPDAVRMGLSGCASRGRGPGPAPNVSDPTESATDSLAVHAWANRVWLAQLGQWRGVTGEIAHAVSTVYPTALAFYRACQRHSTEAGDTEGQNVNGKRTHPMETSLAELEVRRGAGVLTSRRRLGPEFARRLVTHFTNDNPNHVID